ncbi:MAG: MBL fold metallo-hydrolase, partial [Saprospiraceae bacterium]|nr:MBL fold metallo-hydrolase [Saprospiraceae bacterium]
YIPLLVKKGFTGEIHCTEPTESLAEIILKDSAKIQEEEAERANRHGYTKHHPAEPLYTLGDVSRALPFFSVHQYHERINLDNSTKFRFLNAGHILGSSLIDLEINERSILFTGDLGRQHPLLLSPPERVLSTDILVLESTYGDRLHKIANVKEELYETIWHTYRKGGVLMIPTFAVERAQELIYILSRLQAENSLPPIPVYLDSPMGISATEVMLKMKEWQTLTDKEIYAMDSLVNLVEDVQTSRKVVENKDPKVVLAGSGMITGGRILHYLDRYIQENRNTILLVGFQAAGTRGRSLEEGTDELKFFGRYHSVKAEIRKITSLSAHADQSEILVWLRQFQSPPQLVLINHGEPHASDALRTKISHELGWTCEVARLNHNYEID